MGRSERFAAAGVICLGVGGCLMAAGVLLGLALGPAFDLADLARAVLGLSLPAPAAGPIGHLASALPVLGGLLAAVGPLLCLGLPDRGSGSRPLLSAAALLGLLGVPLALARQFPNRLPEDAEALGLLWSPVALAGFIVALAFLWHLALDAGRRDLARLALAALLLGVAAVVSALVGGRPALAFGLAALAVFLWLAARLAGALFRGQEANAAGPDAHPLVAVARGLGWVYAGLCLAVWSLFGPLLLFLFVEPAPTDLATPSYVFLLLGAACGAVGLLLCLGSPALETGARVVILMALLLALPAVLFAFLEAAERVFPLPVSLLLLSLPSWALQLPGTHYAVAGLLLFSTCLPLLASRLGRPDARTHAVIVVGLGLVLLAGLLWLTLRPLELPVLAVAFPLRRYEAAGLEFVTSVVTLLAALAWFVQYCKLLTRLRLASQAAAEEEMTAAEEPPEESSEESSEAASAVEAD
jgi:hypothetical protein